jgi:acetyltransferase-like isoleucine patch superfamily enzyme
VSESVVREQGDSPERGADATPLVGVNHVPQDIRSQYDGSAVRKGRRARLLLVRILNYLTNYVVAGIPSFRLRRWWLERVVGIDWGAGGAVHLHCFVWMYTPRRVRQNNVRFGKNVYINRGCTLDLRGTLTIGDNVSISPDVTVLTATHGLNDPAFGLEHYPVTIEDHVWIGTRALILPGVRLGRGSVVAAGAVVTRDVAPLEVVGGVPARRIAGRDASATQYLLDGPPPLFE